jgi:serine/alanine adding enzyme
MNIGYLQEVDKERWNAYVMKSSMSACYHLTGWKDVIEASFGHKTYYLFAEDRNNEIRGILPLVHLKSVIFGNYMVSLPFFNYGGICADDNEIYGSLLNKGAEVAAEVKAGHIELRHTRHTEDGLPEKTAKVCMGLSLPRNADDLWESFSSKLRSQIRKPSKEGMYAKIGKAEELDNFYSVFAVNMRDLGTPVYSKEFFRNILNIFPDSSWICTVYARGGHPVASGFLVGFKERLEIPWASSLRSFNHFSPNMLLYWSALQFGCERGYRFFDFGRSTPGEGTYRFKEQWGAKPVQLYWHYWLRNGNQVPELNPHNPKYQVAIKIWQKLPVSLTRFIGPAIVKNLP